MKRFSFLLIIMTIIFAGSANALVARSAPPLPGLAQKDNISDDDEGDCQRLPLLKLCLFVSSLLDSKVDSINLLNKLTDSFCCQNRMTEAEGCSMQSIQLAKEVYGEPSAGLALQYAKLAGLYAQMENYELARVYNEKCLDDLERTTGYKSFESSVATHDQAFIEEQCGDAKGAERLYRSAESHLEHCGRAGRVLAGLSAHSLAELCSAQKRYGEAAVWYRKALSLLSHNCKDGELLAALRDELKMALMESNNMKDSNEAKISGHSEVR